METMPLSAAAPIWSKRKPRVRIGSDWLQLEHHDGPEKGIITARAPKGSSFITRLFGEAWVSAWAPTKTPVSNLIAPAWISYWAASVPGLKNPHAKRCQEVRP
jgi:hypothetical protein